MTTSTASAPLSPAHPSTTDTTALAAWLAARRRGERAAHRHRALDAAIVALATTGVPFAARDVSELTEIPGAHISHRLSAARDRGEIIKLAAIDGPSDVSAFWLGSGARIPSGYVRDLPTSTGVEF